MQQVSRDNFGPLIAFLLPGFVLLWGTQSFSPTIRTWLAPSGSTFPTVGSFLYATLASTAAGLILSAVRWVIVDTIYHHTGIPPPRWNLTKLPEVLDAFESLVEAHYHFYQFYANMLVALIVVYLVKLFAEQRLVWQLFPEDIVMVILTVILILGSRDALWKYYRRTESVLKQDSLHSP